MPFSTLIWHLVLPLTATSVGLLAGVMLGMALQQQTAQGLDARCWTERQNLSDYLYRRVMPAIFAFTMLSSIITCLVLQQMARWFMAGSSLASLLVILITIALEVPLNDRFQKWAPGSIPDDWRLERDAWLRNHWWRTCFGIVAFILSITALAVRVV